jgi:hypothetical protein
MKKSVLKKSPKLKLSRETLRILDEQLSKGIVGGDFSVYCTLTGSHQCTGTATYVC